MAGRGPGKSKARDAEGSRVHHIDTGTRRSHGPALYCVRDKWSIQRRKREREEGEAVNRELGMAIQSV